MLRSANGRNRFSRVSDFVERCCGPEVIVGQMNAETIKSSTLVRGMCLSAILLVFLPTTLGMERGISTCCIWYVHVPCKSRHS